MSVPFLVSFCITDEGIARASQSVFLYTMSVSFDFLFSLQIGFWAPLPEDDRVMAVIFP